MKPVNQQNKNRGNTMIEEISLIQTCGACPEQYDAFVDGEQVGYLRLRHGAFTVEYPDVNGKLIYEADPEGDGVFSDNEREYFLNKAKEEIHKQLKEGELEDVSSRFTEFDEE